MREAPGGLLRGLPEMKQPTGFPCGYVAGHLGSNPAPTTEWMISGLQFTLSLSQSSHLENGMVTVATSQGCCEVEKYNLLNSIYTFSIIFCIRVMLCNIKIVCDGGEGTLYTNSLSTVWHIVSGQEICYCYRPVGQQELWGVLE